MNALKKLSNAASFKTRLMVANATVISVFTYMITVWGGTEEHLLNSAQVLQNKAARIVTKLGKATNINTLLLQTNWLSIRQLIFYHSVLQIWKVKQNKTPQYLSKIFNPEYEFRTRKVAAGNLRVPDSNTALAQKSFRVRGITIWNSLPTRLKMYTGKLIGFKKELKSWVKSNVDI